MAGSGQNDIQNLWPQLYTIPVGVTAAQLIMPLPWCVGQIVQYVSGGTCLIIGMSTGMTQMTGAQLLAAYNSSTGPAYSYLPSSTPLCYDGAARFYLAALSATCVVQILSGLDSGGGV